jgi:hypothetical protein
MKKIIKKRIRHWDEIIGHRFFDPDFGYKFFTVKKVWSVQEYCEHAQHHDGSNWFQHYTMLIKTDEGETFKVLKLPFDCKGIFDRSYDD